MFFGGEDERRKNTKWFSAETHIHILSPPPRFFSKNLPQRKMFPPNTRRLQEQSDVRIGSILSTSDLRRALGDETFQADFFELKLVIHLGGSFNGGILEGHEGNPMFVGLRIFGFTPERSFFF